uniref:Uncharacterized protein n=1 Tax=viral metagenome TaxID=1070528 RepID=A0A6C0AT98_9ZZZZ
MELIAYPLINICIMKCNIYIGFADLLLLQKIEKLKKDFENFL